MAMRARVGVLLMLLAAAACGEDDRTQTDYTPSIDKNSVSADDTVATPAPAAPTADDTAALPMPPQLAFAVPLAPLGPGAVRGAGQVKSVARSTAIATSIAGAVAGATYEGAVRQGVCGRLGATIAGLIPATADSLGAGQSSSDIAVSTDSLTRRPHVIVFGRGGRPEICGPIPARGAAPPPLVPDSVAAAPQPSAPDKPTPRPSPGEKAAAGDSSKA
jgi:hypothetical protein